jgi:hypothetical protein
VFPFPDPTALGALVSVGGTFDVEELSSPLEFLGGAAISVGGLRLDALDDLVDLDVAAAKLAIAPTGPITITDNPNLPQCDALDWVAALPGYTGTATVTGNQPCP